MASTLTPNMSLIAPTIGLEPSPTWAQDLNSSLSIIDQHNHTTGQGVQIPPAGLSINTDLPFQGNNATGLRSARFVAQTSPLSLSTDLDCVYVSGVDLYYNDGVGNQVRITQSGGVAGSPGSISNLTSPASAAYVSGTPAFVFESAANTPANLDGGSLVLRNILANSHGLTLNPPASMAADYSITFPAALPGAQSFVTLDNSGNLATPITFANGITRNNLAAVGQQISASSGAFNTTSISFVSVTNLSVSITTTGRPVVVSLQPATGNLAFLGIGVNSGSPTSIQGSIQINRDSGAATYTNILYSIANGIEASQIGMPVGSVFVLDTPSAGAHTYTILASVTNSNTILNVNFCTLVAYEL